MEFIRPKTSKLDSIETHKNQLSQGSKVNEEEVKTQNKHYNLNLMKEAAINMNNLKITGNEYDQVAFKNSNSTMVQKYMKNSPENESVLAASSKIVSRQRKYYLKDKGNYYNDFSNVPRKIVHHNLPNNSQRVAPRRVIVPVNRLSSSYKSIKRRRRKKKRPEFDLSFRNTSSIRHSKSKGYLSVLSKKNRGRRRGKNMSRTFIK